MTIVYQVFSVQYCRKLECFVGIIIIERNGFSCSSVFQSLVWRGFTSKQTLSVYNSQTNVKLNHFKHTANYEYPSQTDAVSETR